MVNGLLSYCPSTERVRAALSGDAIPLKRKELTRCLIAGTPYPLTLSVPVEGGNRRLRDFEGRMLDEIDVDGIALSEHGNWRHVHIGAFEAAYRTTPFYLHYRDRLLDAIASAKTLGELLRGTTEAVFAAVSYDDVAELNRSLQEDPQHYGVLCRERCRRINPALTVFDAIFRLGPEAIFPLAATL